MYCRFIAVGKVISALGNGAFRVHLEEGKETIGLIRGVFKGGRNSEAYLVAGMYVILAADETDEERGDRPVQAMREIVAVVNTKRALKDLKDAGLIKEDEKDDLFDYTGVEEETEEAGGGATMDDKRSSAKDALAEVDIDAI